MVIVNEAPRHCYIKDELKSEIKIGKAELQNELNRFETQLEEIQSNPVQVAETTMKAVKGGPEPFERFLPKSEAYNVLGLVTDRGRVTDQVNFVHFAGAG